MYNSLKKNHTRTKKNKQKTHKKPHSIDFRLRGCIKRLNKSTWLCLKTVDQHCRQIVKKIRSTKFKLLYFLNRFEREKKNLEHTFYY